MIWFSSFPRYLNTQILFSTLPNALISFAFLSEGVCVCFPPFPLSLSLSNTHSFAEWFWPVCVIHCLSFTASYFLRDFIVLCIFFILSLCRGFPHGGGWVSTCSNSTRSKVFFYSGLRGCVLGEKIETWYNEHEFCSSRYHCTGVSLLLLRMAVS